jgi:hypothetical protein
VKRGATKRDYDAKSCVKCPNFMMDSKERLYCTFFLKDFATKEKKQEYMRQNCNDYKGYVKCIAKYTRAITAEQHQQNKGFIDAIIQGFYKDRRGNE